MRTWLEYLTSEEATHVSATFRYWAFAEMLKLGSFDEERKAFNKRTENTAASFPELDQQTLSLVFDEIESKQKGEPSKIAGGRGQTEFKKILQSEDSKLTPLACYGAPLREGLGNRWFPKIPERSS